MTQSTTCPECGATMWRGSLHCCPRREQPAPSEPGSSIGIGTIAVWLLVVAVAVGWLVWFVMGAQ